MTATFDSARRASALAAKAAEHDGPGGRAGRMCPADYRYPHAVFDRPPEFATGVLYVVGGLYGNLPALDCVERLAGAERAMVIFNGDFHWFDADRDWFAEIEQRVARHRAIRGNVETEIARTTDIGAGCGCAYPPSVGEDVVRRSNEMLLDLRSTAQTLAGAAVRMAALPMHLVAEVGGLRVGIVHGERCSARRLVLRIRRAGKARGARDARRRARGIAGIDLFASTHTCLAALRHFRLPAGRLTVINNGAAGMPNFSGGRVGLVSRIATTPSPHRPLYGIVRDGIHIDAIALPYDNEAFLRRFLARWPAGTAAHLSYFERITAGPGHTVARAAPTPRTPNA